MPSFISFLFDFGSAQRQLRKTLHYSNNVVLMLLKVPPTPSQDLTPQTPWTENNNKSTEVGLPIDRGSLFYQIPQTDWSSRDHQDFSFNFLPLSNNNIWTWFIWQATKATHLTWLYAKSWDKKRPWTSRTRVYLILAVNSLGQSKTCHSVTRRSVISWAKLFMQLLTFTSKAICIEILNLRISWFKRIKKLFNLQTSV